MQKGAETASAFLGHAGECFKLKQLVVALGHPSGTDILSSDLMRKGSSACP